MTNLEYENLVTLYNIPFTQYVSKKIFHVTILPPSIESQTEKKSLKLKLMVTASCLKKSKKSEQIFFQSRLVFFGHI